MIYFEIYILVSFEQSVIRAFRASNNIKYTGENLAFSLRRQTSNR
jgi:hypothetical protein